MERSEKQAARLRFLADLAYWAALLALGCGALKLLRVLLPLLLAFGLAGAARPLARFLSRETRLARGAKGERVVQGRALRLDRRLAGAVSVLALLLLLGGALGWLTVRAAEAASGLLEALPELYETRLEPGIERLHRVLLRRSESLGPRLSAAVTAALPDLTASLGSAVREAAAGALGTLTSLAAALPGLLLNAAVTLIAALFIAVDYDRIQSFIRQNLPARPLHYWMTVRNSFVELLGRLIRSYLLIMLITAGEIILGLFLIGAERPVLMGLLIGLVDIFPVVGSGTILLPWAALAFLGGEAGRGGELLLLYLAVTLVRQILEPRILGKRVGLRPIVTLGCMVIGGRLFGAMGLFALPILAAILADLDSSGVIALFHHDREPEESEKTILSEEIKA